MASEAQPVWRWLGMMAVLLFGFALLARDLDAITLWNDETWTIDAAESPGRIVDMLSQDVHPPLYFVELYLWRQVAGESVFALRYLSVLLMLLALALVCAVGRDLFSPAAGWIAALILALHDLARVFTQEVRHYPQHMLLAALAIWLYWRFWRASEDAPSRGRGLAFVAAGAAALWTHYWAGFLLLALAFHALVTRRAQWRRYGLAFGAIGLLFVPWLPTLRDQMAVERPNGLPHALPNTWPVFESLAFVLLGVPEWFWITLGIAGAAGALSLRQWRPSAASAALLLAVAVPVGMTILLNMRYPSLSPRSLSLVIPAAALLIGHALAQFGSAERALMIAFVVAHSLTTTSAVPTTRAPWPEIGAYLARRSASGDVTLMELKNGASNNLEEYTLTYYLDRASAEVNTMWSEAARLEHPDRFPDRLREALASANGIWVANWGWPRYDLGAQLEQLGFAETAQAVEWGSFNADPITTRRFDHVPAGNDPAATFGDGLRLLRMETQTHPGWVTVNLLWSPSEPPPVDYTVSVFLLNTTGALATQDDTYPFGARTSAWQANGLYFDTHALDTRALPSGAYEVGVKVYHFADAALQEIVIAPVAGCTACDFVVLDTIELP